MILVIILGFLLLMKWLGWIKTRLGRLSVLSSERDLTCCISTLILCFVLLSNSEDWKQSRYASEEAFSFLVKLRKRESLG